MAGEATYSSADYGIIKIYMDGVDITTLPGSNGQPVPTKIGSWTSEEPFDDSACTLVFPTFSSRHKYGTLDPASLGGPYWMRDWASVDIVLERPDHSQLKLWEGNVASWEDSMGDGGSWWSVTAECTGAIFQMNTDLKPPSFDDDLEDVASIIDGIIREQVDLHHCGLQHLDLTKTPGGVGALGIQARHSGAWQPLVTGYIAELLASAVDAPDLGTGKAVAGASPFEQAKGYWIFGNNGAVVPLGPDAWYLGSLQNIALNRPITGAASTRTGNGYWLFGEDGGVFTFGDAAFHGSLVEIFLPAPQPTVMSATPTPDGAGLQMVNYWGAVYAYGTAPYLGNPVLTAQPAVGIAGRPQQDGYWVAGTDGAVFAMGNAPYLGRVFGPSQPITSIDSTPTGAGYLMAGGDGGVFNFGNSYFYGSAVGSMVGTCVDACHTGTGNGYWLVGSAGHVYAFGDAVYGGNATVTAGYLAIGIAARGNNGYWVADRRGAVFAFGTAVYHGGNTVGNIAAIEATPTGNGYWLIGEDGKIYPFGDAFDFDGTQLNAPIVDGDSPRFTQSTSVDGYWMLGEDGGVFTFGTALFYGAPTGIVVGKAVSIASSATGYGYYVLGEQGHVYAFGDAVHYGNPPIHPMADYVGILAVPGGYYCVTKTGAVMALGAARYAGGLSTALAAPIVDIISPYKGDEVGRYGYWLIGEDGGVFTFGNA